MSSPSSDELIQTSHRLEAHAGATSLFTEVTTLKDRSPITLDDLQNRGLIVKVEPDQATATGWLGDAGRHLEATTKIAEVDPSGAYVLAYDAARKSVAAALLISDTEFSAVRHPIGEEIASHLASNRCFGSHLALKLRYSVLH